MRARLSTVLVATAAATALVVGCYSGTGIRPLELPRVTESSPGTEVRVQRPNGDYTTVPRDEDVYVVARADGESVLRRFAGPATAWIERDRLIVTDRDGSVPRWYALDGTTEVQVREFDGGLTAAAIIGTVAVLVVIGIVVLVSISDGLFSGGGWGD